MPPREIGALVGLGTLRGHLSGVHRVAEATPGWLPWLHRRVLHLHGEIITRLDELDRLLRRCGR